MNDEIHVQTRHFCSKVKKCTAEDLSSKRTRLWQASLRRTVMVSAGEYGAIAQPRPRAAAQESSSFSMRAVVSISSGELQPKAAKYAGFIPR
jgi:hypothetical protein